MGLEAGIAAGGEEGPVHSAALIVADRMPFPLVDLRVDWDDEDPVNRAINPSVAPSYGVAGDL